jgi:hypothetical protein
MADQPSRTGATSPQTVPLPGPVLDALSVPGINPARFGAVIEAFRQLPIEGQVELANRLIGARGQYLAHRMYDCDPEAAQGVCRKRLGEIGKAADKLVRLLHRHKAAPQPWNLHPAITLALPQLYRIAADNHPNQVRDPPQWLSLLEAMLTDLTQVGANPEAIFSLQFPKTRGGKRRQGRTAATDLTHQLIDIYCDLRARFPKSGPAPAFGSPLVTYVRAGLAFTVSMPPEMMGPDGKRYRLKEATFLKTDLAKDSAITDRAIRGIFDRRNSQTKGNS